MESAVTDAPGMQIVYCFDRAVWLEQSGAYSEAFELLEECLREEHPGTGEVLFHIGWCLEHVSGGSGRAFQSYKDASNSLSPSATRVNCFFRMGWLLLHEKDYATAARMFRRAIDDAERIDLETNLYHNAVYWYAVALENQSLFLNALEGYRLVQRLSAQLNPEARYREMCCLNQVGLFEDALRVCQSFQEEPPAGFAVSRYAELRTLARTEATLLIRCLGGKIQNGGEGE